MLDLHAHFLPGTDDGAKTVEESIELLRQMKEQGVTTAVATPHFFPAFASLDDFFALREKGESDLAAAMPDDLGIKIVLGAEVLYFSGIGKIEDIKKLTIAGGKYLLLELLGLNKIDEKVINDIRMLSDNLGLVPIIAHAERYCKYKGYKLLVSLLEEGAALCQINATFSESKSETRAVKKLMEKGLVNFVASDCHNPKTRGVKLKEAFSLLREMSPDNTDKIIKETEKLEKELIEL